MWVLLCASSTLTWAICAQSCPWCSAGKTKTSSSPVPCCSDASHGNTHFSGITLKMLLISRINEYFSAAHWWLIRESVLTLCVCVGSGFIWCWAVLFVTQSWFSINCRCGCVSAAQQTFRRWTAVILRRIRHHQVILSPGRCDGGLTLDPGDAVCIPVCFGVQVQLCWHHKSSSWPPALVDCCIYCPRGRFRGKHEGWPLWKLLCFLRPIKPSNCTVPNLRAWRLRPFLMVQLLPVALSALKRWSLLHLKEFQTD